MAYSESQLNISLPAAADFSSKQYLFCTVNSSGQAAVAGAAARAIGVIQDTPSTIGAAANICVGGVTKVVASAAIAAGAAIGTTAAGKARTAVSGDYECGVALEAATADGDIITVLFNNGTKIP